jgi:hypothetical protein
VQAKASSRARRRGRTAWLVALVLLVGPLGGGVARADRGDAVARAKQHFEAGRAYYQAGKYRLAIREFEAGYAISPRPPFLLNLGQAHRQLFELGAARARYAAFLEQAALDDPQRPQVEELVREIDRALAEQDRRAVATPPEAPTPPVVAAPAAVAVAPAVSRARRLAAPIAVGAATLVLGATGGALVGSAASQYDALLTSCAPRCMDADAIDRSRSLDVGGKVLLGVSGALLVVDVALWATTVRRLARDREARAAR